MPNSARLIRGGLSRSEIDCLNAEAWSTRRGNPARSAELSRLTHARSSATDYRRGVGQALVVEGFLAHADGVVDLALERCLAALRDLEPDGATPWLAWAHMIIGHVATEVGERDRARTHYGLAERTAREAGDAEGVGAALLNRALLEDAPADRIPDLEEAATIFEDAELQAGLAYARFNLAETLLDLDQVDDAHALAALAASEATGPGLATVRLRAGILQAVCSARKGHLTHAVAFAHATMDANKDADPATIAEAGLRVAEIQHDAGDTEGAVASLLVARDAGIQGTAQSVELARRLADYQAELGDYDSAYMTLQRLQSQRVDVASERTRRRVAILEVLYQARDMAGDGQGPEPYDDEDSPHEESLRDDLTGLPSAVRLDRELAARVTLAEEHPVCLALVDIDELSIVNAELGHIVGDSVLRQIASLLEESAPPGTLLVRYRVEDFALLLDGLGVDDARLECERLRVVVERHPLVAEVHGRRFTVSIGVAEGTSPLDAQRLQELAEEAVSEAKETGRNRVVARTRTGEALGSQDDETDVAVPVGAITLAGEDRVLDRPVGEGGRTGADASTPARSAGPRAIG